MKIKNKVFLMLVISGFYTGAVLAQPVPVKVKGFQFGMALNLDEFGPNPSVEANWGVFIRKEIL